MKKLKKVIVYFFVNSAAKKMLGFGFFALASIGFTHASELVREVEHLRQMLRFDDPTRPTMTLRLADLIFEDINALARNEKLKPIDHQKLIRKDIGLYTEVLNGDAAHPAATGKLRIKILFQLGRLFADLGEKTRAKELWQKLYEQTELPELRREAAIRLAESYESEAADQSQKLANQFYERAIALCPAGDTCYYAHYRRAWLFHHQEKHNDAIHEMNLALFDSKGHARDEALRDLLLFWSNVPGDGGQAIIAIEQLAEQIARPTLLKDLADGFLAIGNKPATIHVLELIHGRTPSFATQVRLLEEYYGERRWDDFERLLDQEIPVSILSSDETEKILRRLVIQLDGQRISEPKYATPFKRLVMAYLEHFPTSDAKPKMIDGWLAAEQDAFTKLKQLQTWINQNHEAHLINEEIRLRESRIAIAQKSLQHAIVLEEIDEILKLTTNSPRIREYRYIKARAHYDLKQTNQALASFQELAKPNKVPDQFAIQAEHLCLDILNEKKAYDELISQAQVWTKATNLQKTTEITQTLTEIQKIEDQAQFERATQMGADQASLKVFLNFCISSKFFPKSCENAKVVAAKIKDEAALLESLNRLGDEPTLLAEYEASGHFAEAATILEKQQRNAKNVRQLLKIALLYELAQKYKDQERILRALMSEKHKLEPSEEGLFIQTLIDSKLLNASLFNWPLSEQGRNKIAHQIELWGLGSDFTKKLVLSSKESLGQAWSKLILDELKKLDHQQNQIHFYGKNSRVRFEMRLASLKKLVTFAEKYLPGADKKTRYEIAELLEKAHRDLAKEILETKLPPNLSSEALAQIKVSLQTMADPVLKKALEFRKLADQQKEKIDPLESLAELSKNDLKALSQNDANQALEKLHKDPGNIESIQVLRDYYRTHQKQRLAYYFEGRLGQLQGGRAQ